VLAVGEFVEPLGRPSRGDHGFAIVGQYTGATTRSNQAPPPATAFTPAISSPAVVFSAVAAMGVTIAPIGTRVGADPVTTTLRPTLRIVATSQTGERHNGQADPDRPPLASPPGFPIAHTTAPVATRPHSPEVKAATGRRCCSLPARMSAAKAHHGHGNPDPVIAAAVHAVHEPSASAECQSGAETGGAVFISPRARSRA